MKGSETPGGEVTMVSESSSCKALFRLHGSLGPREISVFLFLDVSSSHNYVTTGIRQLAFHSAHSLDPLCPVQSESQEWITTVGDSNSKRAIVLPVTISRFDWQS